MTISIIEITDLVLSVATLISAGGAVVIGLRNANRIQNVHLSLNSRLDQLVLSTRQVGHAEGREEARKEEQERTPSSRN